MSSKILCTSLTNRVQIVAAANRRNGLGWTGSRSSNMLLLPSLSRCSHHVLTTRSKARPYEYIWSSMAGATPNVFSYSRSLSTHGWDFRAAFSELWIQKPKEGSGFENFIPKKKSASQEKKESSSQEGSSHEDGTRKETSQEKPKDSSGGAGSTKEKSNDPFKNFGAGGPFRSQNQESNKGNNSNNNGNIGNGMTSIAVMLLIAYMWNNMAEPGQKHDDSHEIDWKEFIYGLVETDQVDKVVISPQKTSALVFLKPGAQGLSSSRHGLHRISFSQIQQSNDEDPHDTATQQEPDEDVVEGLSSTSNRPIGFSSSAPGHRIVYRLNIGSVDMFERKLQEAQRGLGRSPSQDIPVQFVTESSVANEFFKILPGLMMLGLLFYASRSMLGGSGFGAGSGAGSEGGGGGFGGIFKIGKSTAQKMGKDEIKTKFADVAGVDEAKKEIMEFVQFLKDPDRFTKLGAKIPKGALLCGPPGTGKTLLAKAVAGEAGVPFYSISGSNFVEMFVGVGPARVRDLFREARKDAPCIVFIDEIDAVGRKRSRGGVSNDESENTLNQLLVEMDGFSPTSGVVVLAATNRVDILDQALVRPGRFDRQILVDKPDLKGRRQIYMVHLNGLTLADEKEDIAGRLAGLTPGFVGADIANICNEAAIIAARRSADAVAIEDFEKAIDRNIGGMESNKIMSKEERNIVAHHEAGHVVAGWFLEHADPLLKVTIIPRSSGALGFAQYLPKEVSLRSQDQIMDIVCMALAGRAAEEVFFGSVTTGASDDLRRVTDMVYNMIQLFGMNPRLGQLAFPKDPNAFWEERPYSEKTAQAMDEEAKTLVDTAYQRTLTLIREKKDAVEKVASTLLAQETINHDDIVELIGPRPFVGDAMYNEFIERRKHVPNPEESKDGDESTDTTTPSPKEGDLNPGLA